MTDAIYDELLHYHHKRMEAKTMTTLSDIAKRKWRETHSFDEYPKQGDQIYIGHPEYVLMEYGYIPTMGWVQRPLTPVGAIREAHKEIERLEKELKKTGRELREANDIAELVEIEEAEEHDDGEYKMLVRFNPPKSGYRVADILKACGYDVPDGTTDRDDVSIDLKIKDGVFQAEITFKAFQRDHGRMEDDYDPADHTINMAGHKVLRKD